MIASIFPLVRSFTRVGEIAPRRAPLVPLLLPGATSSTSALRSGRDAAMPSSTHAVRSGVSAVYSAASAHGVVMRPDVNAKCSSRSLISASDHEPGCARNFASTSMISVASVYGAGGESSYGSASMASMVMRLLRLAAASTGASLRKTSPYSASGGGSGSSVKRYGPFRSEEHTSELQSQFHLVC